MFNFNFFRMQELIISNERLKAQANEKDRILGHYTRSEHSVIFLTNIY